jgi:hypothetical protein
VSVVLTDTEVYCGVTVEAVVSERTGGLVFDGGQAFIPRSQHCAPALAGAAARYALGGEAGFVGLNAAGWPVYRLVR